MFLCLIYNGNSYSITEIVKFDSSFEIINFFKNKKVIYVLL